MLNTNRIWPIAGRMILLGLSFALACAVNQAVADALAGPNYAYMCWPVTVSPPRLLDEHPLILSVPVLGAGVWALWLFFRARTRKRFLLTYLLVSAYMAALPAMDVLCFLLRFRTIGD